MSHTKIITNDLLESYCIVNTLMGAEEDKAGPDCFRTWGGGCIASVAIGVCVVTISSFVVSDAGQDCLLQCFKTPLDGGKQRVQMVAVSCEWCPVVVGVHGECTACVVMSSLTTVHRRGWVHAWRCVDGCVLVLLAGEWLCMLFATVSS